MSLADWAKNGWLRVHKPTKEEISNLLEIVERDLKDTSAKGLSDDWKFGIAYRPEKNLAHYRTLQSLPIILGDKHKSNAAYLDTCRKKRNETEYDSAGNVNEDCAVRARSSQDA
jgi:hypothetical protein